MKLKFKICALKNLLYIEPSFIQPPDPRVVGMQMMIEIIPSCNNSLMRSIVCEYIARLISIDEYLIEAFVSIDAIELLTKSTLTSGDSYPDVGEIERGTASVCLAVFASYSPEARRRLLKLARKRTEIMESLLYYNDSLHPELIGQWKHFKQLERMSKNVIKFNGR